MKYIRTKDLIYDYERTYGYLYICKTKQEFNKRQKKGLMSIYYSENYKTLYIFGFGGFYMLDIVKQADTIEELCDEFIVVQKDFHDLLNADTHCLQTLKRYYEINKIEVLGIYGAIWTEWGLKYVAKMNEKGELELL